MNRVRMTLGVVSAAAVVLMASCGDAPAPMSPDGAEPATDGLQPAAAAMPSHCPSNLHQRSPEQVLDDHRAALAAGDFDAAICNYATDAIVIGDGGIDTGHEQIRSSLEFFNRVFEGTQPQVIQQIVVDVLTNQTSMVRLLFTIDHPCISVPDGIDTYIIRRGLIHGQTSHAFPVFTCF
jgi:hypothetical protein